MAGVGAHPNFRVSGWFLLVSSLCTVLLLVEEIANPDSTAILAIPSQRIVTRLNRCVRWPVDTGQDHAEGYPKWGQHPRHYSILFQHPRHSSFSVLEKSRSLALAAAVDRNCVD